MKRTNRIAKMFSLKLAVSSIALSGLFLAMNVPAYAEGYSGEGPSCASKVDNMPIEKNELGKEIVLGPLQSGVVVPVHAPVSWTDCAGYSWIKASPDVRGIVQVQPKWSGLARPDAFECGHSGMDLMLYSKQFFPNYPNLSPSIGWKFEGRSTVFGTWVNNQSCTYNPSSIASAGSPFGEFRVAIRTWAHDHTDSCSNGKLTFLPWSGTTMPYCFFHTIVARSSF